MHHTVEVDNLFFRYPDGREALRQELLALLKKEAITPEQAERQFGGPLNARAA